MDKQYNFIDLFCGCGGFTQGFVQAGYNPILGVDMWNDATTTYSYNFPSAVVLNDDITKLTADDLLAKSNCKSVDVIIGGPPCQGFSISGKRMIDDPRNILYKSFVQMVGKIQPSVFVMENVPGLVSMAQGRIKDSVIEDFSNLDYTVNWRILSADDYGVPQHRRRVFFVGLRNSVFNEKKFVFPVETSMKNKVSCKEAISDLDFIPDDSVLAEEISYAIPPQNGYQQSMRQDSTKLFNHVATIHNDKTKSIIAMVPDGGDYRDLPRELWSTRKVHIAWTRMNSIKPCFTIDTGHNHHFHYSANRVPTVRESARIQSFPDSFKFLGIKTSQLKQVGNAVPPLLSQALAEEIKKELDKRNV